MDERVSTGYLPPDSDVRAAVSEGYEFFRHLDAGTVSDYLPALAGAPADAFGVCVAAVRGGVFAIGDAEMEFSIQSISKVFVFALVCDALGTSGGPPQARGEQHRVCPSTRSWASSSTPTGQ